MARGQRPELQGTPGSGGRKESNPATETGSQAQAALPTPGGGGTPVVGGYGAQVSRHRGLARGDHRARTLGPHAFKAPYFKVRGLNPGIMARLNMH